MPRTTEVYPKKLATEISVSDNHDRHSIPLSMYKRVMQAVSNLGIRSNLADREDLVARLPLRITSVDAQLVFNVIMVGNRGGRDSDGDRNGDWRVTGTMDQQEVNKSAASTDPAPPPRLC